MNRRAVEAFQLLGIPRDSDRDTIAHAYRRLARAVHPDVSAEADAAERFANLAEAYRVAATAPALQPTMPACDAVPIRRLGVPRGRTHRSSPGRCSSVWSSDPAKGSAMVDLGADRALFSISVASEVTGVNPQMLRVYEQKGLLEPHRTDGGTRRYRVTSWTSSARSMR